MTYDEITHERSRTHLGWHDCGEYGIYEILICGNEIIQAHHTNVVDVRDGCRPGRFLCYVGHARDHGIDRYIGEGYMPRPNGNRQISLNDH